MTESIWIEIKRRWRLLAIAAGAPLALAVAQAVLAGLQVTLCDVATQGTLPWPIAPDSQVHVLGHNHLELIELPGQEDQPYLHEGIDIMTPAGTEVRAIESGTVVYPLEYNTVSHFGFVVESAAEPGTGFLYLHFDYPTRVTELGDPVEADDVIGHVVPFPLGDTGGVPFDHLHLEAVREVRADGTTPASFTYGDKWEQYALVGTPLQQLQPPVDDLEPEILMPSLTCPAPGSAAGTYLFLYDGTETLADPNALETGRAYDVVARVRDRTHSTSAWDIMPYCIGIQVKKVGGAIEYTHGFQLSGPIADDLAIDPVALLYEESGCMNSKADFTGSRWFYVVTTNSPQGSSWWQPQSAGEYDVTVQVRDSAGQTSNVPAMRVTVLPTN